MNEVIHTYVRLASCNAMLTFADEEHACPQDWMIWHRSHVDALGTGMFQGRVVHTKLLPYERGRAEGHVTMSSSQDCEECVRTSRRIESINTRSLAEGSATSRVDQSRGTRMDKCEHYEVLIATLVVRLKEWLQNVVYACSMCSGIQCQTLFDRNYEK